MPITIQQWTPDDRATARRVNSHTLRLDNVSKLYRLGQADVTALNNVSLEFSPGESAVVLATQRGGRSTLLNIMAGFDTPTSGRVHFGPLELTNATDAELTDFRHRYVGLVLPYNPLFDNLTGLDNVWMISRVSEAPMRAEDALRIAGVAYLAHVLPAQMSAGEQQLVAVARAVVKRPQLLLCDEPTEMLDAKESKKVLQVIERINNYMGINTVVITRHPAVANTITSRVITINHGHVYG